EDQKRREAVERRNHADQLCYGVEKALGEVKDKLDESKVSEAEGKVKALRDAGEKQDDDEIKTHMETLEATMKEIAELAYSASGAEGGAAPGGADAGSGKKPDDDVIDAE